MFPLTSVVLTAQSVNTSPGIFFRLKLQEQLAAIPAWSVAARADEKSLSVQHVIRRAFKFESFAQAIRFMSEAAPEIDRLNHHPEWENVWDTVTVQITTWGVGSQITELDIQLAKTLDDLYVHRFGDPAAV